VTVKDGTSRTWVGVESGEGGRVVSARAVGRQAADSPGEEEKEMRTTDWAP